METWDVIWGYAFDLVLDGATSAAKDDTNVGGELSAAEHEAALRTAQRIIDALRANPEVVAELVTVDLLRVEGAAR
jgi:hypothetical protein